MEKSKARQVVEDALQEIEAFIPELVDDEAQAKLCNQRVKFLREILVED